MTLLERSIGVEDLVLLEPLEQESLLKNLQLRYENKEIYVSACGPPTVGVWLRTSHAPTPPPPHPLTSFTFFPGSRPTLGACWFQ